MIRSTLAVAAGIVTLTLTSFGIEAVVGAPPGWTTAYTLVCIGAGGYVTALVSPRTGVRDAVVMGMVELVFTIGAMLALGGPLAAWRPGMLLMIPAAMLGGIVRAKQRRVVPETL